MLRRCFVILALISLPSLATAADVPYTGNLFESGTPVNGLRTISLAVYDVAAGGSALHTQAALLDVSNGVFHTVLTVPDGIWFGGDRWIGLSVNGGAELSPRVKYYAPPHLSSQLFTRPPMSKNVSGDQWVAIDSLTVTALVDGMTIVNFNGDAFWTGSVAAPAVFMAISETVPTEVLTTFQHAPGAFILPLGPTLMTPVTTGSHVFKIWARVLVAGQSYAISSRRFQALYLPN